MTIIKWKMHPEATRYNSASSNHAATNIRKYDDHYRIDMAAPGRNKEDFSINLEKDILTIAFNKKETEAAVNENERYLRLEFETGNFSRQFTLPETIDKEKISAKYEDGILSIHIPINKENASASIRNINVN